MRMFDDLFRVNGNEHYLRVATQSYGMTSQIMLCPDSCPFKFLISDSVIVVIN